MSASLTQHTAVKIHPFVVRISNSFHYRAIFRFVNTPQIAYPWSCFSFNI